MQQIFVLLRYKGRIYIFRQRGYFSEVPRLRLFPRWVGVIEITVVHGLDVST